MKLSTALLISLAVTAVLTLVFTLLFGPQAFGFFLLLPLGFFLGKKKNDDSAEPK